MVMAWCSARAWRRMDAEAWAPLQWGRDGRPVMRAQSNNISRNPSHSAGKNAYTVTWAPSSTTRPGGILKNSVGLAAFFIR